MGAETAIHTMKLAFENDSTDAVLLIDASNSFNSMNRAVGLHNIQITCPPIAVHLINTYRKPARLFITEGGEIPWYSLTTVNIITDLRLHTSHVSQVWLADDAAAAGKIKHLHRWYERLSSKGKKSGIMLTVKKAG